MNFLTTRNLSLLHQYLLCIAMVLLTSLTCYLSAPFIGYKTVALLFLVMVAIAAMLFDILPVLSTAVLSAFIWNFFFIPPLFTFHIESTEDLLMFLLYFFIAMVNAVLTLKIRREEVKARDKEEKEHTIRLYNTLLNSLSHELRTPVSTIVGAVDTLKESREKLSVHNREELLNQIELAGIRLNRQIDNLLNMSRLETGMLKLHADWCDTNELINEVIQKRAVPATQTILFTPDEKMPLLKFDRGLIEQVLHNLLDNAINYTPDEAIIELAATYQNGKCVITVSDNGNGVPETEIAYLFDKFYRLPYSKTGGTGLGLSIVKGFTEAHNGTVKAENIAKGGVRFTVAFPAEASYLNNLKHE